jgi:hypothetical protein
MSTFSPVTGSLALALTCSAIFTGCASNHAAMSMMAGGDTPTLDSIDLTQSTSNTVPVTKVKLSYEHGASLDMKFSSQKFNIENMARKEERGSGVSIEGGSVVVKATNLDNTRAAAAPRFWPIVRRRRVAIGAEGTEFLVQALDQIVGDRTLIAKVQMISGTKVFIEAPDDFEELKEPGSQAHVYLRRDGKHDIEVPEQIDAELQALVTQLNP